MDRRDHHRVQLRLPARLRWTTPFGQKTEVCASVDVSRGGMLVPCREPHAEGTTLWVTFPFDASLNVGQPEMLARVVRAVVVVHTDAGALAAKRKNGNGNGNGHHKNGHHANGHGRNGANGNVGTRTGMEMATAIIMAMKPLCFDRHPLRKLRRSSRHNELQMRMRRLTLKP